MTKTILTNEQKRILKLGVAIILIFVLISTLRGCSAKNEAKETLAKAEATLAEAKQVLAEAEEKVKEAEKLKAEADKKLSEAEAEKKTVEAQKAKNSTRIKATIFTADKRKEVNFYSMENENYLKLQNMAVTERDKISINIYMPEMSNFKLCEIIRIDNQNLSSEKVQYQDAQAELADIVTTEFLQDGGSITLKNLKEKVSYKIVMHTTEGNFAAVLSCY
jgi:CheY-like chemotaxis protein